jgi:hypothetical protein
MTVLAEASVFLSGVPISMMMLITIATLFYSIVFQPRPGLYLPTGLALLASAPKLNRSTLIQIVASLLIYSAAGGASRLLLRIFPVAALAGVVGLVSFEAINEAFDLSNSPLAKRIEDLSNLSLDAKRSGEIAVSQRFYEAEVILDGFESESSPVTWLLGYGGGATFDMSTSRDMSVKGAALLGESQVHNIHFMVMAFLFRHGLIGLGLICYFMVALAAELVARVASSRRNGPDDFGLIAAVTGLLVLIDGFFASSHFVINPILPYLAAYLDHDHGA